MRKSVCDTKPKPHHLTRIKPRESSNPASFSEATSNTEESSAPLRGEDVAETQSNVKVIAAGIHSRYFTLLKLERYLFDIKQAVGERSGCAPICALKVRIGKHLLGRKDATVPMAPRL